MTHLLDTDHLSLLQQKDGRERTAVVANVHLRGEANSVACVVSFHEQSVGCHDKINRAKSRDELVRAYELLSRVIAGYATFRVLPYDTASAAVFEALRAAKVRVQTIDLRIAAVALTRNLILVTRNVRDFGKVPGLRIEDWTK